MTQTVLAHRTTVPYAIASEDIPALSTHHPLGKIKKEEAEEVALIRDWFPDFAFAHLFHYMLEEKQRLYSWQEFCKWFQGEAVSGWLWEPSRQMVARAMAEGWSRQRADEAMRWRVGNFYYSFLREMHVIAALRERGLPMLFHPLADALFRVDAWCGNVLLELFVGNPMYKAGSRGGRKHRTEDYFADQPGFKVVRFEMRVQKTFGVVHVPPPWQIDRCAAAIRRALNSSHP
ncbi:hypothetical protein [Nocardia goodfellowii]|uniref:Uncharacterized protein n=1 Tax=Nocardia goodfellowii TaxID=882446 RepID=A0ABS4QSK3_9NOCA|nr:hypothetical protein [Nocardia goodfellowii]MBP2193601.1 hypothetical protein [Nocardia goodfellowii]